MTKIEILKYTQEEILQILIDFYNFQTTFDPEVEKGKILTFETKINDWRNICDLLEVEKLAAYYHELFELKVESHDLLSLLSKEHENTLRELCHYIAQNAIKEKIIPVVSLGAVCYEAAIFKTLKSKLEKKGIDTKDFIPSMELVPLFDKCGSDLIEIVSKIAPGSLTEYKYEDNKMSKIGGLTLLLAIIFSIIAWVIKMPTWFLLIPFLIAFVLIYIGGRNKPAKYEIGKYRTIRDLIIGIKKTLNQRKV